MSTLVNPESLTTADLARMMDARMKDKSYQDFPLGEDVVEYLRWKRKRLAANSYDAYETTLDKFVRRFSHLLPDDFEGQPGTELLETFLDAKWGTAKATTYNRHLAVIRDFFKWQEGRGRMKSDPARRIEQARTQQLFRETFNQDQRHAILTGQGRRDRLALDLLLTYGLRRASLQQIQFKHFDHTRRQLTIFAKGNKVRKIPIPDGDFWLELERLLQDREAIDTDYLMASLRGKASKPITVQGLHKWWYRCLANAGIVEKGANSGEHMHKARHTAGQRVLDVTGNLKAVQALLGHASIQTTGDIYVDHDVDRLAVTMKRVLDDDES